MASINKQKGAPPPSARVRPYILSKLGFTASQGLILVILARFGGIEQVGFYAFGLAIVSPVFLLCNLRVQDVVATGRCDFRQWKDTTFIATTSSLVGIGASVGIAMTTGHHEAVPIIAPLSCIKFVESLCQLSEGFAQARGDLGSAAIATAARSVHQPVTILLVMQKYEVGTALWVAATVLLVQYLAYDLRLLPLGLQAHMAAPSGLAALVVSLAPLGLSAMLLSLNQNLLRVIVQAELSAEALGLFATVAYTVRVGAVAARALAQSATPSIRLAVERSDLTTVRRIVQAVAVRVAGFGLVVSLPLVIFNSEVFTFVFGPAFDPGVSLTAGVLLAGLFVYVNTALTFGSVATGKHGEQLAVMVVGLLVSVGAAVWWVDSWGVVGVAYAWSLGEFVRMLLLSAALRRDRSMV